MRLWRRTKSGSEWQKRARKSDVKEAHKSEREDWGGDGESEGGGRREEADWESERQKLRVHSAEEKFLAFSVDFLDLWSKIL